jgi:glycosyltransferase involved in cell wall biosynthesis
MSLTAAVVTSSIGRDTLRRTIESVKKQTYPCTHYVFVNGPEYWEAAKEILKDYPGTKVTYIPVGTGVNNYGMAGVFAASPFLVLEDVILYLDDDNYYAADHVESLVSMIDQYGLGWACSLRTVVDTKNNLSVDDNCESLGFWKSIDDYHLVDNSCYAVRRSLAVQTCHAWYVPFVSDRRFLQALFKSNSPFGCSGRHTSYYEVSKWIGIEKIKECNETMLNRHKGSYPWHVPHLCNPGLVKEHGSSEVPPIGSSA